MTLSADQSNSVKKCFESEETGKIEYAMMKKEFLKHLQNLGVDYKQLQKNNKGGSTEQIDKFWSRKIFVEFHRYFQKNQILSIKKYLKEEHQMTPDNFISNYIFQELLEKVVPTLDSNETKRFVSELTDPDRKMISVEKFVAIYEQMIETLNEKDLVVQKTSNQEAQKHTEIMYVLMDAIEEKGMNFRDYFSQYEFQRQMLTISKKDFYVACGDLEINEEKIHYDDIAKIFDSGRQATLDLAPLDQFIQTYKVEVPFYLSHPKFTR